MLITLHQLLVNPNTITLDDVDPELLAMFEKLGISLDEQKENELELQWILL